MRGGATAGGGGDTPFKNRAEEADVQGTACLCWIHSFIFCCLGC